MSPPLGVVVDFRKFLLSPHGRIGRRSYWLWLALVLIAGAVTVTIDTLVFGKFDGGPVTALASVPAIYPQVCVQTKRLHDLGRSGWLQLVPYGALLLSPVLNAVGAAALATLLVGVAFLGMFIWLGFFKGQDGPNRYGEPNSGDRDITAAAEVFS
jgi:uncharacterized membrane protein YhaH (DUF805 family)